MTMDSAPSRWVREDGHWLHRPWWKVAVNTVLRLVQTPLRRRLVVVSRVEPGPYRPRCVGYGLALVAVVGTDQGDIDRAAVALAVILAALGLASAAT